MLEGDEVKTEEQTTDEKSEGEAAKSEEATDEKKEEATDEAEKKEEEQEEVIPVSKVQERFDEMTAKIKERDEVIETLMKKVGKIEESAEAPKEEWNEKEWPDAKLLKLKEEQPEYEQTVNDILKEREAARIEQRIEKKSAFKEQLNESYMLVDTLLPDYMDKDKPEFKLANKIYLENGLDKHPKGPLLAAATAFLLNNQGKKSATSSLKKQLDKELAKKDLATGKSPKAPPSATAKKETLRLAAQGKRPDSPEMIAYIKAIRQPDAK